MNACQESGISAGRLKRFLAMQAGEPTVRRMRSPPFAPMAVAMARSPWKPVPSSLLTRKRLVANRTASTHSQRRLVIEFGGFAEVGQQMARHVAAVPAFGVVFFRRNG